MRTVSNTLNMIKSLMHTCRQMAKKMNRHRINTLANGSH